MERQIQVIKTYIQEHGQETGTVSWQMAMQALELLVEDYSVTLNLYRERQRLLDEMPECPIHGKCVPFAIEWVQQAKHIMQSNPAPNKSLVANCYRRGSTTATSRQPAG